MGKPLPWTSLFHFLRNCVSHSYDHLNFLDINCLNSCQSDMEVLLSFPKLTSLTLRNDFDEVSEDLQILKSITNLKKLSFYVNEKMSIEPLLQIKNLQNLCLRGFFGRVLGQMMKNNPMIKQLQLSIDFSLIGPDILGLIDTVIKNNRQLKKFSVSRTFDDNFNLLNVNYSLFSLPKMLTHLKYYNMDIDLPSEKLFDNGNNYSLRYFDFRPQRCLEYQQKDHYYLQRNRQQHKHIQNVIILLLSKYRQTCFSKDVMKFIALQVWNIKYTHGWKVSI